MWNFFNHGDNIELHTIPPPPGYIANSKEETKKPIKFYLSTYGGSADDMFAPIVLELTVNVEPSNVISASPVSVVLALQ